MKEKELYLKVIGKNGDGKQIIKAIEELSELQKELCKMLLERKSKYISNIAEEIADVEIMLSQLKIILKNDEMIKNWKMYKLKRLEERLNNE